MAFLPPTVRVFMAFMDIRYEDGRLVLDTPAHTFQPPGYPLRLPVLWFYAQMTGVISEIVLTVVMREFGTGHQLAGPSESLRILRTDSPLDVVEAKVCLRHFPIMRPNTYEFILLVNGREVDNGTYRLNAYD